MGGPTPEKRKAAALTQHAVEVFFRGRYADALVFADQALALDATYARAYAARALCLTQLGNAAEGLAAAERAVALAPAEGVFYTTRAMCKARLGDHRGAQADYDRAVELGPGDFRIYYNIACYWAERGDEERCREFLTDALGLVDPSYADVASSDPDLARFSDRFWFRELLASAKKRLSGP